MLNKLWNVYMVGYAVFQKNDKNIDSLLNKHSKISFCKYVL